MTKVNLKNETPADAKPVLAEVLWDDSKANDKEFLKKWYQYRYELWASRPEHIGGKVAAHYKKAVEKLS
ncbi:MAG: hypothetical protein WCY89_10015 [Flavobacteriaceae bacterium]